MRFEIDHENGAVEAVPGCSKCGADLRPNILLKNDMTFDESIYSRQEARFKEFMKVNENRSKTVLEIGAGVVQPLHRQVGEDIWRRDRVRACLIRINPIVESKVEYNLFRDHLKESKEFIQYSKEEMDEKVKEAEK